MHFIIACFTYVRTSLGFIRIKLNLNPVLNPQIQLKSFQMPNYISLGWAFNNFKTDD